MSESHLGEVIGGIAPMKPIEKPYRFDDGCILQRAAGYMLGLVIVFVLTVVIALISVLAALAHGPAEWIQRGGYKNQLGELCCGERDCFELSSADVKVTPAGYFIHSTRETIPFHEATPSPTGTYWRCQWGGKRKCFFAPPGST